MWSRCHGKMVAWEDVRFAVKRGSLFALLPCGCPRAHDHLRVLVCPHSSSSPSVPRIAELLDDAGFRDAVAEAARQGAMYRSVVDAVRPAELDGAVADDRGGAWRLFLTLRGLQPLAAGPPGAAAAEWAAFRAELAASPLGPRGHWACVRALLGDDEEFDWRVNWCGEPVPASGERHGVRANARGGLGELNHWLEPMRLAFDRDALHLVLERSDAIAMGMLPRTLVPLTADLALAMDVLGFPRPGSVAARVGDDAWTPALLCSSRFFLPGAVDTSGSGKFAEPSRLQRYVRDAWAPADRARLQPDELRRLRDGMRGRALARLAPDDAARVRRAERLNREQAGALERLVAATVDSDGEAWGHGHGARHASWNAFVRLRGVEPLGRLSAEEVGAAWREFESAEAKRGVQGHTWVCMGQGASAQVSHQRQQQTKK